MKYQIPVTRTDTDGLGKAGGGLPMVTCEGCGRVVPKNETWLTSGHNERLLCLICATPKPLPTPQADPAEATPETDARSKAMRALGFGERHTYPYVKCLELARTLERQRNAARADAERLAGELKFVLHELEVASTSVPAERMSIMDELIRRLPGFAALKSHSEESK